MLRRQSITRKISGILIEYGADYSQLIRQYAATNNSELSYLLELPSNKQYINVRVYLRKPPYIQAASKAISMLV